MTKILASFLALLLCAGIAQAADIAKGAEKAEQVCAACHGKDGKTPIDPSYPIIAGQHAEFLVQAMRDYKSGSRKNAIMGAQASLLSSADIDNLAAFYSSLPSGLSHKK
ncbi:MAG: cytochrome c [Burkholderiaceae bacterium]|nr:cytochrome c [Burkholderiaceae bacterium]MEB2319436.1 cytochrome c [Pseudomonadota bacterium]